MSSGSEYNMPNSSAARRPRRYLGLVIFVIIVAVVIGAFALRSPPPPATASLRTSLALLTSNDDAYWNTIITGAQDAARKADVDLTIVRTRTHAIEQSEQLEYALAHGAHGLAVAVRDPGVEYMVLNKVAGAVPVITLESDAPSSARLAFVGTDNYSAGWAAAEQVREAMPDGGRVIITVGSLDVANARERRQGVIDNLLGRAFDRDASFDEFTADLVGKKYSIIATVVHQNDATKATPRLVEAINAHPDINCIVGLYGYSAPAALRALEQTNKAGKVKVIGFDDFEETKAGVKNGLVFSSILQDNYGCGYRAITLLADAVRHKGSRQPSAPRMIYTGISILRADGVTPVSDATQPVEPTTREAMTMPTTMPTTK
ncbi:sugar-binding protein [soil metagenome]